MLRLLKTFSNALVVTISHMERVHGGTMGPAWHMYLGVAHTRSLLLLLRSIIFTKYNHLWLRLSPCIACGFVVVTLVIADLNTGHFVIVDLNTGHWRHSLRRSFVPGSEQASHHLTESDNRTGKRTLPVGFPKNGLFPFGSRIQSHS